MATPWRRGRRWEGPKYPTGTQIAALRKASAIAASEVHSIRANRLTLALPPMGLAVIEIHVQGAAAVERKP